MQYYAHSNDKKDSTDWQSLKEHLINTANRSGSSADKFGAKELGYLIGLLHDVGKYSEEFQQRLRNPNIRADHSTASAQLLMQLASSDSKFKTGISKMLAYITAGHHSGLPDWDNATDSNLSTRLHRDIRKFTAWSEEIQLPDNITLPKFVWNNKDKKQMSFQCAFLIRMLYSCLVDADYLDTEKYMDSQKASLRTTPSPSLMSLRDKLHAYLNIKMGKVDKSEINKERKQILESCITKAEKPKGLFTLTVPTGGGKTLSSLAFALDHAIKHQLDRIIYVIPYTSIIEQNAAIFREILGDDAVLEHHCNYEMPDEKLTDDEGDSYKRIVMATENWNAPVIVTTNVQFFESLFANRSSRCRKLHNMCRSVIILDEAQMMNTEFIIPSIKSLEELVRNYKSSVILCTATQPYFNHLYSEDMQPVELMQDTEMLYQKFKRVNIQAPAKEYFPDTDLMNELLNYKQVLCILNTRIHASKVYSLLKETTDQGIYHLSGRMYPIHRLNTLKNIRKALKDGLDCRVISTQLVEAGVDLDFPVVYRSLTGLDSIAQAAGRCNREGKRESGLVKVFRPEGGQPKGWFSNIAETTDIITRGFPDDLLQLKAIQRYFEYLYNNDQLLDRKEIYQLYENIEYPFEEIADKYKLIDNGTIPIIIPDDEEIRQVIGELECNPKMSMPFRKFQRYSVQVYHYELLKYKEMGVLNALNEFCYVLKEQSLEDCYDMQSGLKYLEQITKQEEYYIA